MTPRRWILVGAIGLVIAVLLVVIGFDVPHGVLGGLVWVIGILLLVNLDLGQRVALPRLPFGRRDGARTEVSSLSWSLYGTEGITYHGQQHLRRVCTNALTEAGVDLDAPDGPERARALLGPRITDFLLDPESLPPDVHTVRATVLILEKLEKSA